METNEMKPRLLFVIFVLLFVACSWASERAAEPQRSSPEGADSGWIEMPGDVLRDKIRGGLLGQMLGNLNGIPHEMRYINEPGNVTEYTPALPEGARTDDDTDLEWVYIYIMQKENRVFLSPQRIAELWKRRINKGIWCSNRFARHLMNLGFAPPLTSRFALNPWADWS